MAVRRTSDRRWQNGRDDMNELKSHYDVSEQPHF